MPAAKARVAKAQPSQGLRYTIDVTSPSISKAKKNRLQTGISKAGKAFRFYDKDVEAAAKAVLDSIPPEIRDIGLIHPNVSWKFYVPTGASDRDGMHTNILDAMKEQGVIVNDSVKWYNGTETILPAEVIGKEAWGRAIVTVEESAHGRLGREEMTRRRYEAESRRRILKSAKDAKKKAARAAYRDANRPPEHDGIPPIVRDTIAEQGLDSETDILNYFQ